MHDLLAGTIFMEIILKYCSITDGLWECPVYDSIGSTFMGGLDKLLGGGGGGGGGSFEEFSTLDNFNRTGFILGSENWDRYECMKLHLHNISTAACN